MSRIPTPALELATGATAEIYAQIKKAIGKIPNTFAAIGALALAALLIVTGCSANPLRTPVRARADEATAERVYSALNDDPMYLYRLVDVRVDDGVAKLSGYVWSTEALYHAKRVASTVSGVKAVVNQLQLESGG